MADAIFTLADGTDVAAFAEQEWHRKGTVKGRLMASEEALIDAAFDRINVVEEPIFTASGPVETHKVVRIKDDSGQVYKPFVVGKDRPTFDFGELLSIVEQAAHISGASVASVFRLKDGAIVGASLKNPETTTVCGDQYQKYTHIVDSIDASMPTRMWTGDIRMRCWNTVQYAMNRRDKSRTFTLRHTKNAKVRAEDIRHALELGIKQDAEFEALMAKLIEEEFTKREFHKMVDGLLGTPDPNAKSTRGKTIYDKRMTTIDMLWKSPTQENTFVLGKSTKMTAFQTMVEYFDHARPMKGDAKAARFASNFDGSADVLKGQVLTALGVSI